MPKIDLPDDELAGLKEVVRRAIEDDKYPLSPRLDPLRAALARLAAATAPEPIALAKAPPADEGDKRTRRSRVS